MAARGKTISEKILSAKSGTDARAGDIVVCDVDLVIGTDASSPMAIDYFEQMGGERLFDPARVVFSLDHYSPPSTPKTAAFHDQVRAFARRHGATVFEVGEGISHQVVAERGRVLPGDLVIGADSHTVTLRRAQRVRDRASDRPTRRGDDHGPDLAARAGDDSRRTRGRARPGRRGEGRRAGDDRRARCRGRELSGARVSRAERRVRSRSTSDSCCRILRSRRARRRRSVHVDAATHAYLSARADGVGLAAGWTPTPTRSYRREVVIDLATLSPRVAIPHVAERRRRASTPSAGTPVHMVFLGTCTGGRVSDFHEALRRARARAAAASRRACNSSSRRRRARYCSRLSTTARSPSSRRWARSSRRQAAARAAARAARFPATG